MGFEDGQRILERTDLLIKHMKSEWAKDHPTAGWPIMFINYDGRLIIGLRDWEWFKMPYWERDNVVSTIEIWAGAKECMFWDYPSELGHNFRYSY
jgi:hypothetical protein